MKPSPLPPGIGERARETLAAIFNHVLAEESTLAAKTRAFVFKVTGPNVHSLNRLFDAQRRQIDAWLDELAERARAFGVAALGGTRVPGDDVPPPPPRAAKAMVSELLAMHEAMIRELRADLAALSARAAEPNAAQLLNGLLEFHETTAWMLRVVLDGPEPEAL